MQRQYVVKIISYWLSYAGGAFIKVIDSAGSTVHRFFTALKITIFSCMF